MRPPIRPTPWTLCAAAALLLAGCATSPELDRQFGDSARQNTAQQTLHPQAALNTAPVNGMDGRAAAAAYDNYQRSYTTPVADTGTLSIGVGGASH